MSTKAGQPQTNRTDNSVVASPLYLLGVQRQGPPIWAGSLDEICRDCSENAVMESFWARMQVELLDRRRRRTRIELAYAIFEYLDIFPTGNDATPP